MKRIFLCIIIFIFITCNPEKPSFDERKICTDTADSIKVAMDWTIDCIKANRLTTYAASDEEEHDGGAIVRECGEQSKKLIQKNCRQVLFITFESSYKEYNCDTVINLHLKKTCEGYYETK